MTDTRPLLTVPPTPENGEGVGAALIGRRVKVERAYEQLADALRDRLARPAPAVRERHAPLRVVP